MEKLISNDKVLSLIYDKIFHNDIKNLENTNNNE